MINMKQTKFKVGDVVENKAGLRGIVDTIKQAEALIQAASLFSKAWATENCKDDLFGIEWFNGEHTGDFITDDELTLCRGIKHSSLCYECEYRFKCWTTRRK